MRVWLYHLVTLLLATVAVAMTWSSQAAWGRLEIGTDRYKFGLLGVAHISAETTRERIELCRWYDVEPIAAHCRRAAGASTAYRLLRIAPVMSAFAEVAFVLAAFAHLRRGKQVSGTGLAPFALASAVGIVATILLVTLNVGSAVEIYAEHGLEMRGSGLTAAWLSVGVLVVAAAMSRYAVPMSAE